MTTVIWSSAAVQFISNEERGTSPSPSGNATTMSAFRERDGYRERDRMGGYRDDSYRGRDRSPPPYRGGYRDDYRGRGGRGRDYDERDYYTPDDRQGRDGYCRERERSPPKDKMLSFKVRSRSRSSSVPAKTNTLSLHILPRNIPRRPRSTSSKPSDAGDLTPFPPSLPLAADRTSWRCRRTTCNPRRPR